MLKEPSRNAEYRCRLLIKQGGKHTTNMACWANRFFLANTKWLLFHNQKKVRDSLLSIDLSYN